MDHELWARLGVGESGIDRLRSFAALAEKWTARINLVSKSTVPDLWARHIEDSARIALFSPAAPRVWADFGAGGGFPGIVVAAIQAERRVATRMILVESDQRKATFLREAARLLALDVEVRAERAESLTPIGADVVSARAMTALDGLCAVVSQHGLPDGVALFPKGETWEAEVVAARKNWSFELDAHDDPGHKGAAILELRNLHRAGRDTLA